MTVEDALFWIKVSLWVTAIVSTAFPLWYGFGNRWWTTRAGKSMLMLATCNALAWDTTLLFQYWQPQSLDLLFWINIAIHGATVAAGVYVMYALWYNRRNGQMVTVRYTQDEEAQHE